MKEDSPTPFVVKGAGIRVEGSGDVVTATLDGGLVFRARMHEGWVEMMASDDPEGWARWANSLIQVRRQIPDGHPPVRLDSQSKMVLRAFIQDNPDRFPNPAAIWLLGMAPFDPKRFPVALKWWTGATECRFFSEKGSDRYNCFVMVDGRLLGCSLLYLRDARMISGCYWVSDSEEDNNSGYSPVDLFEHPEGLGRMWSLTGPEVGWLGEVLPDSKKVVLERIVFEQRAVL